MEAKHTSGPWTVGGPTGFLNQVAIEPSIGCAYGKTDAAHNARLMAAAPDLLVALQLVVDKLGSDYQLYREQQFAIDTASDAIAKATGETE